jgi:predicted NBD/HSP70 family sugar kinase
VSQIREELAAAIAQTGIFPVGLGVAVAGDVVDHHGGMLLERSNFLGWDRVPLLDLVIEAVDLPTTVVNDINALAGAHHWYGAGAPPSMVVYGVGAGVGAGVVVGGTVITGSRGRAGRVGHDFVGGTGLRCGNGHTDCVHSFITIPAIEHNAGVEHGEYELALERARGGERRAAGAFRAAAVALGTTVAETVNVLDPDVVTIMGEGTHMIDLYGREFREAIADRLERGFPDEVTIERPPFHFDLYARGAAVSAIRVLLG